MAGKSETRPDAAGRRGRPGPAVVTRLAVILQVAAAVFLYWFYFGRHAALEDGLVAAAVAFRARRTGV